MRIRPGNLEVAQREGRLGSFSATTFQGASIALLLVLLAISAEAAPPAFPIPAFPRAASCVGNSYSDVPQSRPGRPVILFGQQGRGPDLQPAIARG